VLTLGVLAAVCACTAGHDAAGKAASPSPASAAHDPARPLPSPVPEIVARVNGEPIHLSQILPLAKADLDKVHVSERDAHRPVAVRHALQRYIDRELLLQEALAHGIKADTRQVDWAYDQARREYPDDQAWRDHLAAEGFDQDSFKAELRIQHTVSALLQREVGGLSVSEDEARSAYEADPSAWGVEGDAPPFEEVKDHVRDVLLRRKRADATRALVSRLRARARIETYL